MKIIQGDCLKQLEKLPDESIDMCVTSPPYWALRDYGMKGQLGLEPTFQEYITKLCDIFDEVKRVLKKTGTCWVNIGDTYAGSMPKKKGDFGKNSKVAKNLDSAYAMQGTKNQAVSDKCLIQIPSRFAIEMTNRGWILRNEIIWHKPNCMPSSAKDRFTVDFEKIFFFVKNKKYWFETQYEKSLTEGSKSGTLKEDASEPTGKISGYNHSGKDFITSDKRNKRAVWKITTKGFKEAHFAVYPEKLIETPIRAGCPEFICKKCGKAREKTLVDTGKRREVEKYNGKAKKNYSNAKAQNPSDTKRRILESQSKILKEQYTDCGCNAGFEGGTILDPFAGALTTAVVAKKLKRDYIMIELNPGYIEIGKKRLKEKPEPMI